jgi:hypothetical protein
VARYGMAESFGAPGSVNCTQRAALVAGHDRTFGINLSAMPAFVTCRCHYCDGHIEFDASSAGEAIPCPHCGLETTLYVPQTPLPGPPVTGSPPSPSTVSQAPVESKRRVSRFGIAALAFGIMSCLCCWVPWLGLSAILLAFIGLLFASAGIIMATRNRKSGFFFPISGNIVCVVALFIGFITGRFSKPGSLAVGQTEEMQQGSGLRVAGKTLAGREWSRSLSVTQENVQIVVVRANVGTVWYRDAVNQPQSAGQCLTIGLGVANVSDTKKVDFETWRGAEFGIGRGAASLSDNYGNNYKRMNVTPAPNLLDPARDTASIRPTERFYDPVVFEVPVRTIKWLHLELPAENFGGRGMLRFEIPANAIKWPALGEQ